MSTSSPHVSLVQELYVAYFGRPADPTGLQNFDAALDAASAPTDVTGLVAAYQTNAAVKTLVDAFGTSTESTTLYGSGSTETFVNAIFENLFNRAAAVDGLTFWTEAINSGAVSKGLAALAILEGALQNTTSQGLIDQSAIANKLAVADFFTAGVRALPTVIAEYSGPYAATDARLLLASVGANTEPAGIDVHVALYALPGGSGTGNAYNLPAYPETLVGGPGSAVYNAVLDNAAGELAGGTLPTLVAGDSISSQVSDNIFNIADLGTGATGTIPGGITVSNMAEVNIESLEGIAGDFSAWQGMSYLRVTQADGDIALTVGSEVVVTVIDTAGNVAVRGGSDIAVTTDSAHAVTITSAAQALTAAAGDSTNTITDVTAGASARIAVGSGANTITLGAGASGTISFAAHSAADAIALGASGANLIDIVKVTGLNNAGSDTIKFFGDANTLTGFTEVTVAEVGASGGNAASLASWVAAADGAAGSGVSGAAHGVTWFVFQGNTYLLESVAGQSADAGTMAVGNTLVELMGTGYTFAHASGANGTIHLLG
ncbi:MAG TPA: DUF4214 domain-containing protein [Burkholderiaceae bacterium]